MGCVKAGGPRREGAGHSPAHSSGPATSSGMAAGTLNVKFSDTCA